MSKIERSILEFLHDILEFATGLQRNIASISKEDFFQNEMAINYAERNFEKIGEAVSQIQKRDPNILFIGNNNKSYWENTKGVRNRIIHEYWGTSLDMIYDICLYDLEELKEYVQIVINYLEKKIIKIIKICKKTKKLTLQTTAAFLLVKLNLKYFSKGFFML